MRSNPIVVVFKSIGLLLMGRARFPKERIGTTVVVENREYTVFRQVVMNTKSGQPAVPEGLFRVWFYSKMSLQGTIRLSWLTLLGFMGLPGFHSKLCLINSNTGEFGGLYEWLTVQAAHNYDKSYAMKFSKCRSIPGTFMTEVISKGDPRSEVEQMAELLKL